MTQPVFSKRRQAQIRHLGKVLYSAGLRMQKAMAGHVINRDNPDQILVLEHNPVFTLGRGATRADIHVSDDFLLLNGVEVHQTDRGGQVTYHGDGQIVVYPICSLRGGRQSVNRFVTGLEQVMIATAYDFGVTAEKLEGQPGVWVNTARGWEKLGAIGIHLKRWIATHGIAFNLCPNMTHFKWITPCGITDMGVCSLKSLLGDGCPTWDEACASLVRHLAELFAFDTLPVAEPTGSISVTTWRRGNNGQEILMMLRCPSEGQWWSSVTGMIEPGETPEMTALREVREETGLTGKLISLDFRHSFWIDPTLCDTLCSDSNLLQKETPHLATQVCVPSKSNVTTHEPRFNTEFCFHMEVAADSRVILNPAEHSEYRWCAPEEARALMTWEGGKEALRLLIEKVYNA